MLLEVMCDVGGNVGCYGSWFIEKARRMRRLTGLFVAIVAMGSKCKNEFCYKAIIRRGSKF